MEIFFKKSAPSTFKYTWIVKRHEEANYRPDIASALYTYPEIDFHQLSAFLTCKLSVLIKVWRLCISHFKILVEYQNILNPNAILDERQKFSETPCKVMTLQGVFKPFCANIFCYVWRWSRNKCLPLATPRITHSDLSRLLCSCMCSAETTCSLLQLS